MVPIDSETLMTMCDIAAQDLQIFLESSRMVQYASILSPHHWSRTTKLTGNPSEMLHMHTCKKHRKIIFQDVTHNNIKLSFQNTGWHMLHSSQL